MPCEVAHPLPFLLLEDCCHEYLTPDADELFQVNGEH